MSTKRKATSRKRHWEKKNAKGLRRAGTTLPKIGKAEVVWSHVDFVRQLAKAQETGAKSMSHNDLLGFCHGVSGYQRGRFCVDLQPFFVELWRRINEGELKMTKSAACRRIGCSRQWANAIVSGRADARHQRPQAKGAKGGKQVSSENGNAGFVTLGDSLDARHDEPLQAKEAGGGKEVSAENGNAGLVTLQDYVDAVWNYAFAVLGALEKQNGQLYRDVCEALSKQFAEASKTPLLTKELGAGGE